MNETSLDKPMNALKSAEVRARLAEVKVLIMSWQCPQLESLAVQA
ncbi:hypothetical protein [Arthrobacter bambusae]|jgi:hypothetical protein|uniref:Uncharacterized protein n=1 Tax=Arthrobacter bambusae TaxID=1338426 RepID=A0AAW8DJ87_9MICC|nr:hypothetical protein [Arthrobacter bambusae]MDP9905529.1 hypothetical protein [Arthrobacter bambusae]MDQ0127389.1 hypothetical protein [Arthrobacter bambusae]MDQ0178731.1 hypothetical protein [Arthrobacter bambusae]